jgi:hypothetical protein
MTGREFLDALTNQINQHGQMEKEYNAADLTRDASGAGLWYRKANTSGEVYAAEREEAIETARKGEVQ